MFKNPLRRALVAFAAVALLLPVAIAQVQTDPADDPVLVRLGATEERASLVLERFDIAVRGLAGSQGVPYGPDLIAEVYPFLPQFLEQRASELVLLDQARARGLEVEESVVDGVVDQARSQFPDEAAFAEVLASAGFRDVAHLREIVRETELIALTVAAIESEVTFTEDEVRVAYAGVRSQLVRPEEVCARHILVESEAAAGALGRAARVGADFAAMAETASIDGGSAADGGDLGCFARGVMVPPFEAAAFAAETGVATEPVESDFGFHVILVYDRVPAATASLEEVREPLEAQLRGERVDATIAAYQRASGVATFPERIPPLEVAED
ncbi:MAG: peptidylprolyl isomerase [Trueperaceae bacterium]